MENGDELNLVPCALIKNSEGKTPNDHASRISADDRVEIGSTSHTRQHFVNTLYELNIKIFALAGYQWRASASSVSASEVNRMIMRG